MPTLGNEPLGIVEEAQRRREQYARYIERRVDAELRRPPTRREIERRVAERVRHQIEVEVRRLVARRLAARLKEVERSMPKGPPIGDVLQAVAAAAGIAMDKLVGLRRQAHPCPASEVAILLMGEFRPDLSLENLSRIFGNRDHEFIVAARERARELLRDPTSECARWYETACTSLQR
jgi:chromosomal replication initiation ATPase DnaA